MLEVLPYILVIVGWNPDKVDETMAVDHRLFISQAECELHGNEYVAQRKIYAVEFRGAKFRHFCFPAPNQADLTKAIEQAQ